MCWVDVDQQNITKKHQHSQQFELDLRFQVFGDHLGVTCVVESVSQVENSLIRYCTEKTMENGPEMNIVLPILSYSHWAT